MATSSSSLSPLPLNMMVHMLTIKLTSSNYLLWRNQFIPLLTVQDLLGFLDDSSKSVAEFSRIFKGLCDQLAAIGHPIDDLDKVHWFLRALGPDYKIFSTTMLSQLPLPSFVDIIPKALSHEIFERSMYQQSINSAFYAQRNNSTRPKSTKSRKPKPSTASASKSFPSSPVYCQICDKEGHLAKQCWTFLNLKKKQSLTLLRLSQLAQFRTQ
ncbi:hypothetical protein AAG906_010752 [Vitis piasezkii]